MADIEDFQASSVVADKSSVDANSAESSLVSRQSANDASSSNADQEKPSTTLPDSIPGTQTVYVKTWGCSHNVSDGEYMAGLLAEYGYRIVTDEQLSNEADVWLLNSCTVKGPSQDHFMTATRRARSAGKKLVIAGCVPQGDRKIDELMDVSVVGVQQIDRVVEVVEETLKGNSVKLYKQRNKEDETGHRKKRKDGGAPLSLPKIRRNPLIEIIPINTGCLNTCTYCKTKHARGDLGSYAPEEILARIRDVRTQGVKEIWLTSEDTGAYGLDIDTNIGELLTEICQVLDEPESEGLMVRLGMTNPPYIMEHMECVSKVLNHSHVYSFLHIPVQSASDNVLDDMKRKYHCSEFVELCDYLLKSVPRIHIATDVICGFPTESEDDFQLTVDLIDKYRFPSLNISQFYPRPHTPAAKMKKLDTKIVKSRSRKMSVLWKSYTSFDDRIGEVHNVLITELANDGYHYVGHNKSYDHFLVPPLKSTDQDLMGQCVRVKVVSVGKFHLLSQLTEQCEKLLKAGRWNTDGSVLPTNATQENDNDERYMTKDSAMMSDIRITFVVLVTLVVFVSVLIQNYSDQILPLFSTLFH